MQQTRLIVVLGILIPTLVGVQLVHATTGASQFAPKDDQNVVPGQFFNEHPPPCKGCNAQAISPGHVAQAEDEIGGPNH